LTLNYNQSNERSPDKQTPVP